ncbi:MAG: twin-arginine translocase subunit TatB [Alphaproteobacteria bacterium]|nr:twin-arginine translocase subunit TatB [Alphaproteobacteria bacterium]
MFDIGWAELGVIAVVALVAIGPRDLPRALHAVGVWVGRARGLVREFQQGMEEIAREAELDDLRKKLAEAEEKVNKEIGLTLEPIEEMNKEIGAALEPPVLPDLTAVPSTPPVDSPVDVPAPPLDAAKAADSIDASARQS